MSDKDFDLDKIIKRAMKTRKWKPLNSIDDLTGWKVK